MAREDIVKVATVEVAKASPPVAVVAHNIANGWTMSHTATAMVITYTVLQMAYLLWKWRNERTDRRARIAKESCDV